MTVEIEVDESANDDSPDVVIVNNDPESSPVQEATTIVLVDRLARVEEHLSTLSNVVNEHDARIGVLTVTDEVQQEEIESVATATTELAADVPEIAEDIADTTTEKPDEPPTSKEHWYYRKWGRKAS